MARSSDSLKFDSVVVLESLQAHERHTGRELKESVLDAYRRSEPRFRVEYEAITSADHMLAALQAIDTQMVSSGHYPIIHFECHGTVDGMIMANGDRLHWESLRRLLTSINERTKMNLFVVLAMCRGFYLTSLLRPLDVSPVWGLLGPDRDVVDADLLVRMRQFYSQLLGDWDTVTALRTLNDGGEPPQWKYRLNLAEMMYCAVMKDYFTTYCSPEALADRENKLVAAAVKARGLDLRAAFTIRAAAKATLADRRLAFERYRPHFLMIDRYPELAARFTIRFDDCVPAA